MTRGGGRAPSGSRLAIPAAIAAGVVGFLILTAVAGSPTSERSATSAARAPAIKLRDTRLGRIVVDARERTLYLFLEDTGGRSSCYGGCARVWPPALTSDATPAVGPGLVARKLTTVARRGSRLAIPAAIAAGVVGFLILTAVAGSPTSQRSATSSPRAPAIKLRNTRLGRIVVDARERTLYLFLEDTGGRSSCYGGCARVWPPALTSDATPAVGPGLVARKLTTVARRGSRQRQLVYNGHPLYTVDSDAKPGDTTGQGVFDTWFAVSPAGKQVGRAAKGGGGY